MIYIGIDPGASGAVCAIHNGKIIKHKMPLDPSGEIDTKALYLLLRELAMMDDNHMIVHEDVHSVYGASAKGNFSFGRNVGFSLGTLKLSGLKHAMAQPKTWQKEAWAVIPANVRASIKDTSKEGKASKAITLRALKQLFPNETFMRNNRCKTADEGIVDAVGIAYYCSVKYKS